VSDPFSPPPPLLAGTASVTLRPADGLAMMGLTRTPNAGRDGLEPLEATGRLPTPPPAPVPERPTIDEETA
jgi:hypothetical protein